MSAAGARRAGRAGAGGPRFPGGRVGQDQPGVEWRCHHRGRDDPRRRGCGGPAVAPPSRNGPAARSDATTCTPPRVVSSIMDGPVVVTGYTRAVSDACEAPTSSLRGAGGDPDNRVALRPAARPPGTVTASWDWPAPPATGRKAEDEVAGQASALRRPPDRLTSSDPDATRPAVRTTAAVTAVSPGILLFRCSAMLRGAATSVRPERSCGSEPGPRCTERRRIRPGAAKGFMMTR